MATPRNARPGMLLDPGAPINKGLVGWWPMWEGAGGKTLDISGKNNHGTLTNGPVWAGNAIDFDGSDDHVLLPLVSTTTTDFTMCAWVWPEVLPQAGIIISNGSDTASNGWGIGVSDGTGNPGSAFNGLIQGKAWVNSGITPPTQKWSYLCATVSGTEWRFFVDGVFRAQVTAGFTPSVPTVEARIGMKAVSPFPDPFNGRIGNARIFNRILTSAEIQTLYSVPNAGLWVPDVKRYYIAAAGGAKKYYLGGNAANRGQRGMGWAA